MGPEEAKDWMLYKEQNDRGAHQRLCERYLKDVRRIVDRMGIYIGEGVIDREDLVQAGVIGLIDAIEKFDPGRQIDFLGYAVKRIRGAVYDELRALDMLSHRTRKQKRDLDKLKEQLQNKILRQPTEEEIADEMGLSLEKFRILQNNVQAIRPEPLECTREEGGGIRPEVTKIRDWIPAADGLCMAEKFRIIASRIDQLPERTKIVMGLYYRDGLTLKEISEVMGLTESRICQIHAAALETLQQQLSQIEQIFVTR